MNTDQACPCCSGLSYAACCKEIIEGSKIASSPEELMRSRFTAHAVKHMPHIIRTMQGKPLKLFDEEKTRDEWFDQCVWTKLEIVEAPEVAKHEKQGIVEFKAYYTFQNQEHMLHERSKFLKTNNQWYYISGQNKNAVIETSKKIGRNEDCSCGSGKKFKKCCGGV